MAVGLIQVFDDALPGATHPSQHVGIGRNWRLGPA
jgi:hypothetical protein